MKMVSNRMILIRVTKNQHERIKNNANAKGYKTMSEYIRSLALEHDLCFETKFNRLYDSLLPEQKENNSKSPSVLSE